MLNALLLDYSNCTLEIIIDCRWTMVLRIMTSPPTYSTVCSYTGKGLTVCSYTLVSNSGYCGYWPSAVSATGLLQCPLLAFYSVRYWPSRVSATGLLLYPLLAFCCVRYWPSAVRYCASLEPAVRNIRCPDPPSPHLTPHLPSPSWIPISMAHSWCSNWQILSTV